VVVVTPQPVFALSVLQFEFSRVVPDCEPAVLMVQPAAVCRVIVSVPARLTPSITSISPLFGQLGPKSLDPMSACSLLEDYQEKIEQVELFLRALRVYEMK
jgi:hypothetical protein